MHTTERTVEIPWALAQLPPRGLILDIGSCEASYLSEIPSAERTLHCLDARDCMGELPSRATFFAENLIGCDLERGSYDAVLMLSTLEHIGMPYYGQAPFLRGDALALAEAWTLLKPGGKLIVTVPAGRHKTTSWYRQYAPTELAALLDGWADVRLEFFLYEHDHYREASAAEVAVADYYDRNDVEQRAGALACVTATRP